MSGVPASPKEDSQNHRYIQFFCSYRSPTTSLPVSVLPHQPSLFTPSAVSLAQSQTRFRLLASLQSSLNMMSAIWRI